MHDAVGYRLLADLVLLIHVAFVIFVVVGLVLILAGAALGWSWVRNPWVRFAHLTAIGMVVLQAWFGVICPLTIFENALRARAGVTTYTRSFIIHWLEALLYYQAPFWVFIVCYTLFGLFVAWTWYAVRPWPFRKDNC